MSAEFMEQTLRRWEEKLTDPATSEHHRRQIKDWAVGATIALMTFGHDDLAKVADEIWNPRNGR